MPTVSVWNQFRQVVVVGLRVVEVEDDVVVGKRSLVVAVWKEKPGRKIGHDGRDQGEER